MEQVTDGRDVRFNHQHYESWNVQTDVVASCGTGCTVAAGKVAKLLLCLIRHLIVFVMCLMLCMRRIVVWYRTCRPM